MEAGDGLLQALAPDEPHRVKRLTVVILAEAVNRDDARVLQPAGDLGLDQKAETALGVGGVLSPDHLERDLSSQLLVEGHIDLAQPPAIKKPDDAKSTSGRGRRADRAETGRRRVLARAGWEGLSQGRIELGVDHVRDWSRRPTGRCPPPHRTGAGAWGRPRRRRGSLHSDRETAIGTRREAESRRARRR